MVIVHVHGRFRTVVRNIYLDNTLTEEDRTHLNRTVAGVLEHWRRPTGVEILYSYVIPAGAPLIEAYKFLFPGTISEWMVAVQFLILMYVLTFVTSAFMCKRSLMLGASGSALYFPGAISGTQGYGKERDILASVGIEINEWPFDIALISTILAISLLIWRADIIFFHSLGLWVPLYHPVVLVLGEITLYLMLGPLALYRRRVTGRC
jgi:hypothetical protein